METDPRTDFVRAFDNLPKALRVVILALAVALPVVLGIGYAMEGRWGWTMVWVIVTGVWGLIALTRLNEADRYGKDRPTRDA